MFVKDSNQFFARLLKTNDVPDIRFRPNCSHTRYLRFSLPTQFKSILQSLLPNFAHCCANICVI